MENLDFPEDDVASDNDFQGLFAEFSPVTADLFGDAFEANATSSSSPGSLLSCMGEIENLLMKDDDEEERYLALAAEPSQDVCDGFFADLLVDSPQGGSAEVTDGSSDKDAASSDGELVKKSVDGGDDEAGEVDDAVSKKRRRQLRNRDAAARSRERKKSYVKELEVKSKYLEGECRRLGRLLQCILADNQALRLSLHNSGAGAATMAKQESAVLLLESLLLGSLLWFLGVMCLFTLPVSLRSVLVAVSPESVGETDLTSRVPSGVRKGTCRLIPSFIMTRRCKASRTKMRFSSFIPWALV